MEKWHNLAKIFFCLFLFFTVNSWFIMHEVEKQPMYREDYGCNDYYDDYTYSADLYCDRSYSSEKIGTVIYLILLRVRITFLILGIIFWLYGFSADS